MENFWFYTPALLIGVLLGLMGGGGSILTVPVFVYIFGLSPIMATGYSLFVVGCTSLAGAFTYARKKLLNVPIAVSFFIPSFITVFLVRKYLLPAVPQSLCTISGFEVTKSFSIMIFFALAMFGAAISMIKRADAPEDEVMAHKVNYFLFFFQTILVGFITGIAGAGGGFLIVPALVILAHLKMRLAVGTSLLIIAINSLVGFTGDLSTFLTIEWQFLLVFTSLSIAGIFIGSYLSGLIPTHKLRKGFGWFILIISIGIIFIELNK